MIASVGHSDDIESGDAISEILESCAPDFEEADPQVGILFAAIDHDFSVLQAAVQGRYPSIQLIGCSTDGEASSRLGFAEDSVTLLLLRSERVRMSTGVGTRVSEDPGAAARAAVDEARETSDGEIRLCVVLTEGLGIDTEGVVTGVQNALPPGAVVCGGMAGDQLRFSHTVQIGRGEVLSDSVCVLAFSGAVAFSRGVSSGWTAVGSDHRVTRADGNVIALIDDRPAGELYEHYFGGQARIFPLAVYPEEDETHYLAVVADVTPDGGLAMNNHVPEGALVRFADATIPEVLSAAEASASIAVQEFPGEHPAAGLLFSCAARRYILGTRTSEEIELLREHLALDIPLAGFYTYAELCPLPGHERASAHNCTLVTVLIGEE